MTSSAECSMYESRQCGVSTTWWHHPEDFNAKDIIKYAATKYNYGVIPALKDLTQKLKSSARQFIYKRNIYNSTNMINRSISAMDSIAKKYGAKNVSVFILPTKNDRNLKGSLKGKLKRRASLQIFLESIDKKVTINDLRECPLGEKHFFRIDGHPNEEGHKLLGMCALNQISNSNNIKY